MENYKENVYCIMTVWLIRNNNNIITNKYYYYGRIGEIITWVYVT